MSPVASPRSKVTRSHITSSEFSIIQTFVKTNIKFFLRLVSSEIHMVDNISLNEQEVDALRILLYLEDDSSTVQSLARASEFFKDYATKEELTTV